MQVHANNPFFSGDSYTTELTDQNFNNLVGQEKVPILFKQTAYAEMFSANLFRIYNKIACVKFGGTHFLAPEQFPGLHCRLKTRTPIDAYNQIRCATPRLKIAPAWDFVHVSVCFSLHLLGK